MYHGRCVALLFFVNRRKHVKADADVGLGSASVKSCRNPAWRHYAEPNPHGPSFGFDS